MQPSPHKRDKSAASDAIINCPHLWAGQLFEVGGAHPRGWPQDAANAFTQRMVGGDERFPCIFGVDATRKGTLRLTFIPAGAQRNHVLARALTQFRLAARSLVSRTSLVCLFEDDPQLRAMDDYRDHFWQLLQWLHEHDPEPWPAEIDTDPESSKWEFSFAGMPFFVVASTPAHRSRRSRHMNYFAITFQPRFVFDDLGADSPKGVNARRIIRRRLNEYDEIEPPPTLGSFGCDGNKEWLQYFLDDDNDPPSPHAQNPMQMCPHLAQETTVTNRALFDSHDLPMLPAPMSDLLPRQGSIELQNDDAGKTHEWHYHSVAEELLILSGEVTLAWLDGDTVDSRVCGAGARIKLPANIVHRAIAGVEGAVYIIRPLEGAPETVWLGPEERPAVAVQQ